jgi:cystathionine beta-lyase/cystathionine gamma-synthase
MADVGDRMRMETLAVHAGERRPGPEGAVVFPIFQGTVYGVPPGTAYDDIQYGRLSSTPTQRYLHDKLAALEGAEAAVATSSGMAAIATTLLTFMRQGDHLLLGDCLYGGTLALVTRHADDLGWSYSFVDPHAPETWSRSLRQTTRLFLVETITNPLMRVPRLRDVARFGKEHGLVTVVDNTFASPMNFRPLAAGFDVVFHSATKYLNGHSDLVAGCVMGTEERVTAVRKSLNHFGGTLDPHAGFLLARGIKTMALRVKAQNANAEALARFLATHPAIAAVHYPGLATHPDHAHAKELLSGFGGMLSFTLRGGEAAALSFLQSIRIPAVAPSLGGVESLVTRPATTSHAGLSVEERLRIGVGDDLIRVSAGIENADDLIEDFRQALERAS